jgi:hypothetical protein
VHRGIWRSAGASLLQLLLKQLQRPPSEEVGRVAVVLLAACLGCRMFVPQQCDLFDEIAQAVVVMFRADIAYI